MGLKVNRIRLEALTSLRFIAAFLIVIYHLGLFFPKSWEPFQFFERGVLFFFVLSGFILQFSYSKKWEFKPYFVKRLFKIYPLQVLMLLTTILEFNWPLSRAQYPSFIMSLFLVQSWFAQLAISHSFNSPTWSLSVEVFFYLIFPLLRKSFIFPLLLILFNHEIGRMMPWFAILNSCLPYFCTGVLLGNIFTIETSIPLPTLFEFGAFLLVIPIFWKDYNYFVPRSFIFGFFIYVFAHGQGQLSRLLKFRPIVILGESSFSLYMIHSWILSFIFVQFLRPKLISPVVAAIIEIVSSVLLSIFCYYFYEKPIQKFSTNLVLGARINE